MEKCQYLFWSELMFWNFQILLIVMKMLISQEKFNNLTSRELVPLQCKYCQNTFYIPKSSVQMGIKKTSGHTRDFCSLECFGKQKTETDTIIVTCKQCNKSMRRSIKQMKKVKNVFCSSSCSATYNNTHKTKGNRRSKLEIWIEQQLTKLYPSLEINYNKTDAIDIELDIYVPSLKLAFELNGIFHYEPIYGKEKLDRMKFNDVCKFQKCLEKEIELCIIDTTKQKYFKEKSCFQFLEIIETILKKKLERMVELEST